MEEDDVDQPNPPMLLFTSNDVIDALFPSDVESDGFDFTLPHILEVVEEQAKEKWEVDDYKLVADTIGAKYRCAASLPPCSFVPVALVRLGRSFVLFRPWYFRACVNERWDACHHSSFSLFSHAPQTEAEKQSCAQQGCVPRVEPTAHGGIQASGS